MNTYPIELHRQHEASQVVRARVMNPEKVRSSEAIHRILDGYEQGRGAPVCMDEIRNIVGRPKN